MPATVWVTFGQLGWRGRERAAAVLAVSAVAMWTEPVLRSVQVGQIELVLMALIAWDLCQPDHRWWKGAGIGVAAGIKLVPLIFIPYLVLAGKLRQAAVATAVFAATVVIGFIALPHESVNWWLTGYFLHAGRLLEHQPGIPAEPVAAGPGDPDARGRGLGGRAVACCLAAVVGCLGPGSPPRRWPRTGRPTAGWVTCAVTGVLISPISWDNHWVWIVPLLAVLLADAGFRARGAARWGYWGFGAALAGLFADWPTHWTGRLAFVPHGLVGFDVRRHPMTEIFHLHGIQLISWNLFVLGGLAMFAFLVSRAWLAWRDRLRRGGYLIRRPISSVP